MKHRNGFVSNSSTTSFVIVGACLDSGEFREFLNKEYFLTEEFVKDSWSNLTLEEMKAEFSEVETYSLMEFISKKSDISIENGYNYEQIYVGVYPGPDKSVKGESILQQMKRTADKIQNIEQIINECKYFTKEGKKAILKNLQWHSEAWRDG